VAFNGIFITGQLFVDRHAPPGVRGQAQSLLVVLNHGFGALVGAPLAGALFNRLVAPPGAEPAGWPEFWLIPAIACLGALVFIAHCFREEPVGEEPNREKPIRDASV
jgi:MFS family permease